MQLCTLLSANTYVRGIIRRALQHISIFYYQCAVISLQDKAYYSTLDSSTLHIIPNSTATEKCELYYHYTGSFHVLPRDAYA